ncbi:energy-coupling factor transporter transmembrane component T family protein [Streptococcus agalactiae]|uniref:energy-coupling factor transporter transmembrane component T family protein n=1 Tax=Streptococcus agalactiae TaxID=1311 RepID=UPI0022EAE12C|nr:energy-coupling factor transporter transmembrane component T [Streptococcus agalactiae]
MFNLKNYHPAITLLCLLIPTFSFSFTLRLRTSLLFLIIVVTLQCFVKVSLKTWAKVNLISFVMGLSLFLGTYFWGKLPHQFVLASLVACRPLIFMNVGLLFHASHSNYDFIESLYQTFKVPSHFAYGIFAVFNLLPLIKLQYQRNRLAFRLKNQVTWALSPRLILSVLLKTIYWVEQLELAMLSKGFEVGKERTHASTYPVRFRDYSLLGMSILLAIGMIFK